MVRKKTKFAKLTVLLAFETCFALGFKASLASHGDQRATCAPFIGPKHLNYVTKSSLQISQFQPSQKIRSTVFFFRPLDRDEVTNENLEQKSRIFSLKRCAVFSIAMIFAGGLLGPFLDSYHSVFGVLTYNQPLTLTLWGSDDNPALITSWWVPELFGLAGFIIGWLYILFDLFLQPSQLTSTKSTNFGPSIPKVLAGISLFTFQYWLSGALYHLGWDRNSILNIMSLIAASGFVLLDGSFSGFVTSSATALGGPLIEVGLLTMSKNNLSFMQDNGYHYNDLGETGFFPMWILPVYFFGGPAVGNLARGVWRQVLQVTDGPKILESHDNDVVVKQKPKCQVCHDTRRVPCPNCDGVGTYAAMGNRIVQCTSCRGRGFVICRSCFSFYGDDPNDIEAVRRIISRMPD